MEVTLSQTPCLGVKITPEEYSMVGLEPWCAASRWYENLLWKATSAKTPSSMANLHYSPLGILSTHMANTHP